jgi:hypothetical protein
MPKPACARKPARHFAYSCILSQKSRQKHDIHGRRLSPSAERYVNHFGVPFFALGAKNGTQKQEKFRAAAGKQELRQTTAKLVSL